MTLGGGGTYISHGKDSLFSSAVPPGSGAFQMPTCPSSSAASSASASTFKGGEGPISETLQ